MTRTSLAISLLVAMTVASVATQAFLFSPGIARTAPCHGHSSPLRSPGPVSHKCCQTGHQAAVLQEAAKARHSTQTCVWAIAGRPELLIPPRSVETSSNQLIPSGSPPIITPLRI
jgi:hypothetical protein